MTKNLFVSYQRGAELVAGGCPVDYLDALADRSTSERNPPRVRQLGGYTLSRVYMFGAMEMGFSIALRLETDRPSGTIIADWSFEPPWRDIPTCWDYEPQRFVPRRDREEYRDLLDTPLLGVLNDRRRWPRHCIRILS